MATVPTRTTGPLVVEGWGDDGTPDSKSERYLSRRLAAASADYKAVAFTTFMLAAAVVATLWIGCGVALEHWVVPGGLPRWARWAWLAFGVTALVAAALRWLLPLMVRRVNLVYAARVIEEEHPELHNDLVNTVLVKAHPEGNAAAVVRSLERRAARRLSATPPEGVIDRSAAVWLSYALAAIVAAAMLYGFLAPKSLLHTAARLLLPWSRIAAPTRVAIASPALRWRPPGDAVAERDDDGRRIAVVDGVATLIRGRQLVLDVGITGLRRDERPEVIVTPVPEGDQTAGRQKAPPWRAELARAGGESGAARFRAVLPDASRGLDQSADIAIVAGDARGEPLRVAIVDSPTLLVREVRYEFPEYMRREPETVAWQGDLRAVEGARVVLVAESNQPLDSAWIDFDCDGRRDLKMKVGASDLARATGSFTLAMNAERTAPEHGSYRLLFQIRGADAAGRERLEADRLEHRIEVLPDLAPEVSIEDPKESPIRVPPTAPVPVTVRALDPDFGLARVAIEVRLRGAADGGGAVHPEIPLARSNRRGVFVGTADVVPERYGATPGAVLEYRAIAVDTRPNEPNIAATPWQSLSIDPSAAPRPQPPDRQKPQDRGRDDAGRDGEEAGDSAAGGDPGAADDRAGPMKDGGRGDRPDGEKGDDGRKPNDGRPPRGERADGADAGKPDDARADGQREGQGDDRGMKQADRGAAREGEQQRREDNDGGREDASQGGEKGKPKPGDQDGAADGGRQGGKTPQSGGAQQRGGSQGQPRDRGDAAGDGDGGAAGAKGKGAQPRDASGKTPGAGAPGTQRGDGATPQGGGQRPGANDAAKGQKDSAAGRQGERSPADGQAGGREAGSRPRPAVAADGTNDGEAMERILENRRRQQAEAGGQKTGDVAEQTSGSKGSRDNAKDGAKDGAKDNAKDGAKDGQRPQGDGQEKTPSPGKDAGQKSGTGDTPQQGQPAGEKRCATGECEGGQCEACRAAGGGSAGGGKGAGGQQGQGAGKEGAGKEGAGKEGAGKEGAGKEGAGKEGAGKEGAGKEGAGKEGAGKEGAGKEGAGKEGAGKEGAGKEGAGKEGAAGGGQGAGQAAGDQPFEAGGQKDGRAGPTADGRSSPVGGGGVEGGTAANDRAVDAGPQAPRELEWGRQELENARNAADLAIAHLRDAVARGRSDVLDELGWTPEQARAFLDRWETMRQLADSPDPRQRGEFERLMRSLGLRPDGARNSRDVPADVKGGQAEGRRSRPPSDYRERFKAFLQGASGE